MNYRNSNSVTDLPPDQMVGDGFFNSG